MGPTTGGEGPPRPAAAAPAGASGQLVPPPHPPPPPPGSPSAPGQRHETGASEKPKRGRVRGLIGFVTDRGIPLLIAMLGLAAALATTWGAVLKADANDLEDSNASLRAEKADLEAQISALEEDLDTVTADRDELSEAAENPDPDTSGSPDEDDTGTPPVTTSASPRESTVLRETGGSPVTFSSGYSIDLDSDLPDWDVKDTSSGDLYYYDGSSGPRLYTGEVSIIDHTPTEAECDDATVLQPDLQSGQTRQGLQICMRTNQDRFAYVHVVEIDEEANTITVDLIVWE